MRSARLKTLAGTFAASAVFLTYLNAEIPGSV